MAFAAEPQPLGRPDTQSFKSAKVDRFVPKRDPKTAAALKKGADNRRRDTARAVADQARTVTWPKAGAATVSVPATGTATATPGSLPVTLSRATSAKLIAGGKARSPQASQRGASVKVNVLDQKRSATLDVKGVVLTVTGPSTGGAAQLGISYKAFASAYGGDWAGRLQVVRLPDCALKTPSAAKCRTRTPLEFTNQREKESLNTRLDFAETSRSGFVAGQTMVLALAAGDASAGGDFKATPLGASSTWEAGGSSGSFTWSYPLRMPPPAAGPEPDLKILYDSGSVDGRTASTNNQGTLIGEGFDLTSSYIERKYGSCDEDGQADKFDQCWKYENASLVLNGKATELVKDDTTGKWRLKSDDASTVTLKTGADNGDDNGEYWVVTTGDGTQYHFGLNKLDGATTERTESTWTVPVFGDDPGEPGYDSGTSFSGRSKEQAWRWNLDYVVDTHDNAMTYWYAAELNYYDTLGDDNIGTEYTRGGYLKEIRYGQRAGTLFSGAPAASNKVVFTVKERCLAAGTGCDSLTDTTRDNWPDVPFDAICKKDVKCTGNTGPTFFSRKRLTAITTHAWDEAAATPGFVEVDAWALTQQYLDPGDTGDSSDQSLWLDQIQHTGKRGTEADQPAISMDAVNFDHVFLANRLDTDTDGILPYHKPRLYSVTSETGSATILNYHASDCVAGQTMPRLDQNTKRCYPVYWKPNGATEARLDWFLKYLVRTVDVTDPKGGAEAVQHYYTYHGGGAWRYNDDPMTKESERTWSQWRGYREVKHYTGASGKTQSKTVTIYLRGMHGDRVLNAEGKLDPTARKSVSITGIKAPAVTDADYYAGFTRESATYNGASGAEVSGSISDPWAKRTATQHKSYADTEAYYVRTNGTHERVSVSSGGVPVDRVRSTVTTYDSYGMPVTVDDRGDDAVAGDEKCTRTWYARNDALGINGLIARTRTVATGSCLDPDSTLDLPADSKTPGDVVSDTAVAYDSEEWTATQTPTKGEPRWTGRAKGYGVDDQPLWQKVMSTTYDTLGRPLTVADANDTTTATNTYTPADKGPLTASTVANALGHKTSSTIDFATGAVTKVSDPNGKVTESVYDSMGRVVKVWLPIAPRSFGNKPYHEYTYNVTSSGLSWVKETTVGGTGYNTGYTYYDSMLRPRQTQVPAAGGGRIISQTLYDHRGLAVSAQSDIWDANNAPGGGAGFAQVDAGQAPIQTDTTYDGAGRAVKAVTLTHNVPRWTVLTSYTGDSVSSTAPAGGQATTVFTNALGQTTKRYEYAGTEPTGTDYTQTTFTYHPAGQQAKLKGPDNAEWTYTYDLFGRLTETTDPDKGAGVMEYDSLDRPISATDARSKKLISEYDVLGRKTGLWETEKSNATKLAAWTFDTVAKGQQTSAVRYDGGLTGKAYTQKINQYDSLYRPRSTSLVLPLTDPLVAAGVPSTLTATATYNLDGTVKTATSPAVAGLPAESMSFTYDNLGLQQTASGTTGYQQGAVYSPYGDFTQLTLGVDPTLDKQKIYVSRTYEEGTRRIKNSSVTTGTHAYSLQNLDFSQDEAGNVTSIFDSSTLGGTSKADNQCFAYDGHRRLTEAWTPKTADCAATGRTTANLDGAAPYWTSYTYNEAGQRKTETEHTAAATKTRTYTYGTSTGQPHPLTKTATGVASEDRTYAYDKSGNTTGRPGTQAQQTLTWNSEGELVGVSEPAAGTKPALGTSYLYDAAGELLIRRATGNGDTVLYLGGTEVRLTVNGTAKTLSGTRYYGAAGQTIAVRTATAGVSGTKLEFLASDHHGTSNLSIDSTTLAYKKRYSTPFGASRGASPSTWPDDKGFLGKPEDTTTGLTHIGAREYDPKLGQFISVDPLLATDQHQSLNGYSYANQHPSTASDPTGMQETCGYSSYCGGSPRDNGGNPGTPGNSGSKAPSGGALGSYDDAPTGTGTVAGGASEGNDEAKGEGKMGNLIVLAEVPSPPAYAYQVNGVCVWAMAGTCAAPSSGSPDVSIPDLPCGPDESAGVCNARNSLYKFAVMSGMQGGSLGFFGLRSGTRWNQLVKLPEGITRAQFDEIAGVFRKDLKIEANVVVQGSRVTGNVTGSSDLDIAVRVSPSTFNALVAKRWGNAKPGSALAKTRDWAIKTGKITAGDARPKLSGIRSQVQGVLGDSVHHVDVSIIKMGGDFDNGPFIGVN